MNQSKKNDKRFWVKWLLNGSVPKRQINLSMPFRVDAIGTNCLNGWSTISVEQNNRMNWFVTRNQLDFDTVYSKLPKDAIEFEQGRSLVEIKL